MKKLSTIIATALVLSVAFWTAHATDAFAKTFGAGVVIGKEVRNERGVVLGRVENIVLSDQGCAKYVILSGRFKGARARLYPIPWTVIARTAPEAIFVDVDPAILVEAPSFEASNWPDFSQPQWETRVSTFYRTKIEAPFPGKAGLHKEQAPGGLRSEEKPKSEADIKTRRGEMGKRSESEVSGKAGLERERKHRASEMMGEKGKTSTPESAKQKDLDVRTKQHVESQEGATKSRSYEMMERGKGHMERGQMMMERGKGQMDKGKSQMEKGRPGQMGQERP